jgi:hypothetical protein
MLRPSVWKRRLLVLLFASGALAAAGAQTPAANGNRGSAAGTVERYPIGYEDTPFLPGGTWRVHDRNRPRPEIVAPGTASTQQTRGRPPSDAIVLFDGKDLSKWQARGSGDAQDQIGEAAWKFENGYFEVVPRTGAVFTKDKFGARKDRRRQPGPRQVQVLDSYDNVSYADGQAGAIYGQYPPLVNASRKPGEWQTYDIVFEAPRFEGGKLVRPAYATVIHNGVLLHHRRELLGPMQHRRLTQYEPHEAEGPLMLQQHSNPVRYRNIWVRRLDLSE